MIEKIVKARKKHDCTRCGGIIRKGNLYKYISGRQPKFADDHETQIGIEFFTDRLCLNDVCDGMLKYAKTSESDSLTGIIARFNELEEVVKKCSILDVNPCFDIERLDLYDCNNPDLKERTKARLTEIAECGMEEVMTAEFGYKGVMSGLYIERVWGYCDEDFKNYMDWAKGLIAASLNQG